MKTRSKKSLLGLFGHVPWGLSRLKTGPGKRKRNAKQREMVSKSKEKRKKMTFPLAFISSTLTPFSKIQTYILFT